MQIYMYHVLLTLDSFSDFSIYSDPQNHWYVYNIWLVIIISQQPIQICIYFLHHIDAMHVGYTPYKYYGNPFSI